MSYLLEVKEVSKSFGNHRVLNKVSFGVREGSIFGLLGPNGAGKTTLIRIINRIIFQDEGEILLNGHSVSPDDVYRMGYLPEERGLYTKMQVGDHMMYMARLKGLSKSEARKKIEKYFKEFEISGWWYKKIEQLSKGMQQKLQFIIAIMHEPRLVILDEPFTGFDPVNIELIKKKIIELKNKGAAVILSTHRMESVEELCDDIALINKANKIIDGNKWEIKNRYKQNIFEITSDDLVDELKFSHLNGIEFLEKKEGSDGIHYFFRLSAHTDSNALLKKLLDIMHIKEVKEKVPTVNEIFISLVNQ